MQTTQLNKQLQPLSIGQSERSTERFGYIARPTKILFLLMLALLTFIRMDLRAADIAVSVELSRDGDSLFQDQEFQSWLLVKRFQGKVVASGVAPNAALTYRSSEFWSLGDPETDDWSPLVEMEWSSLTFNPAPLTLVGQPPAPQTVTAESYWDGNTITSTSDVPDGTCPGLSYLWRECGEYGQVAGAPGMFYRYVCSTTDKYAIQPTLPIWHPAPIGSGYWTTNWHANLTLSILENNTVSDWIVETFPIDWAGHPADGTLGYIWWIHGPPMMLLNPQNYTLTPSNGPLGTAASASPHMIWHTAPAASTPWYRTFESGVAVTGSTP